MTEPVVGRLAPSPTGALHVGHARSFLLAWWQARALAGRVVLRVEDLDRERVKPGATELVLRDLEWLGLEWDGPVRRQSEEEASLVAAAARLAERGLAFACACTRREIAMSAPHEGDGELRYPGTCRERGLVDRVGETGLRLRVEPGEVAFDDGVFGRVVLDPGREAGDFLVRRRDGAIAYQLAVVVHDAEQGVTHVLRGRDLLASTARQLLLQRHLGLAPPAWFHVPLVVDDEGRRLAKRSGGLALSELRGRGVDPRALVAWAARSAGLAVGERVEAREVVEAFGALDLARMPRADVRFGRSELEALGRS